jgi:NAD(P)-dependent dehydrogenase (short-subunit alcohol dehydrogenase family)
MEFQDRSVLVTGAAGGIGRATAVQFAKEGARLTLSDRDTVRGEETLSAVRAVGGTAQFIYGDVVSEPFVQHLVDAAVKTYGRLDCAFNNAGIIGSETTAVDQFSLETWQNVGCQLDQRVSLLEIRGACHATDGAWRDRQHLLCARSRRCL